jgi:hypothetical protein
LQRGPFDGPLLDSELLAKRQIIEDQVPSTKEQIAKYEEAYLENVHVGRPIPTPVPFVMVSREPAILRKFLKINKNGVLDRDSPFSK